MRTLSILGANGIYNNPNSVIDDGPAGTDNPLWIDQKYKGWLHLYACLLYITTLYTYHFKHIYLPT